MRLSSFTTKWKRGTSIPTHSLYALSTRRRLEDKLSAQAVKRNCLVIYKIFNIEKIISLGSEAKISIEHNVDSDSKQKSITFLANTIGWPGQGGIGEINSALAKEIEG